MKKITLFALSALTGLAGLAAVKATVKEVSAEGEQIIKPFADYRFQDATNLGKDTSGNGFDLNKVVSSSNPHAFEQLEDEDGKYLSIARDEDQDGNPNGGGAYLYAPQLGTTGRDWSDLIQGNFTVTMTIKSDTNYGRGDRYNISFGRYNSALCMVAWRGAWETAICNSDFFVPEDHPGVEKQAWLESNINQISNTAVGDTWINITCVGNVDEGKLYYYVNGVLASTYEPEGGVRLTNIKSGDEQASYTFCIGAQCDMGGTSTAQYGTCCYRQISVWDCALSADNVATVVGGSDAVLSAQEDGNDVYVTNVEAPDLSDVDFQVTDANKLSSIVKSQLGSKKLKVTTSDGQTHTYPTLWYPGTDGKTIYGKAVQPAINLENKMHSVEYTYTCKMDVDENKVEVSEVLLDGDDFEFGTAINEKRHSIEFILTPKKGVTITTVIYNEMEFEPEEADVDGYYYIQFSKGALIVVETSGQPEGQATSSSEAPVGSSEAPTSNPTSQPTGSDGGTTSSGCGGSIAAGSIILALIGFAGVAVIARKKEN